MNKFVALVVFFFLALSVSVAQSPTAPQVKPAATSAETPEIGEFQKLENSWSNAVNMRDQYGLELVLSPLFVDVASSGDISTRNQQLAQLIVGEKEDIHLEQRVITVRMLGDIAVANGTYTLHHRVNSTPVDEKGVFTHVFERVHGGWACINSQRTLLRAENPGAKPKKQSTAEMPFHIPLFSKSDKTN